MEEGNILAAQPLDYGCAQLVEWHWPSPLDLTVLEDRHMIEMSIPPFATDGVCAFPAIDPAAYSFMGGLFVRPAGVALHARSGGGRIRVVRLAVAPDAGNHARCLALEGHRLADGLDLRYEAPRFLLNRIAQELREPSAHAAQLLRSYCDALLIEVAQKLEARRTSGRERARLADWQYERVRARIEAEGTPPTLAELAAMCGLGTRHFSRLYRALTGETGGQAIERERIARARLLLEDGAVPLKVVAQKLGYAHDSAFSAAFRRSVGTSPGRWRRRRKAFQADAGQGDEAGFAGVPGVWPAA